MENTVRSYIAHHNLLDNSNRSIIVGLSGGADSVALLAILSELGYKCLAAHCNFNLRNDESYRDEHFSASMAKRYNAPFHSISFNTKLYAKESKISIEMAARNLRYRWFDELRIRENAQAVAVGHHRDDNAETLLINLTRGAGIRGLRGMLPRNGSLIRPLLCVSRSQIIAWLKEKSLEFVIDSTNLAEEYTRNIIRLRLIPILETINPSAKENLARAAERLAEIEQIYLSAMAEAAAKIMTSPSRLDTVELMRSRSPSAILYELMRPFGFSRPISANLFKAINSEPGRIFYSSTHRAVTTRDHITITPLGLKVPQSYTIDGNVSNLDCGDRRFSFTQISRHNLTEIPTSSGIACLDRDKLRYPLTLRRPQPGDRFIPLGMNGHRKLSDFFTSLKYDLADKENAWILCTSDGKIAWVAGERIDNRFRVTAATELVTLVEVKNISDDGTFFPNGDKE
ncbi:MAG: tRNA lysidine(34) synthetase TilS [Tannerellaceae bacterium]|jgi:tRNA(Ile)-lysidine synthase|nr:tRNA lysidine(34) synthetase TilS [Tannerellaceae bacterium]